MKQRFSSLDVKVIAHELNSRLATLRVANIYDLSTRIFLFKFQKPDHREQFVVDSGFRCHLTSFVRTTAAAPSPFVQKLRKTLKTRRVTSVSQVGTDRIIEFQFSDGLYHLFLEFYAGGNIILTDNELNIIALLRNVNEGAEHERLRVGLKYNLSIRQNYGGVPPLTKERVKQGLQRVVEKQRETEGGASKKSKKKGKDALRKSLAVSINEFPPMLVDHAMRVRNFDSTILPEEVLSSEQLLDKLLEVLQEAQKAVSEITGSEIVTGYILAKKGPKKAASAPTAENSGAKPDKTGLMYDDFHPFKPRQFEDDEAVTFLEFKGFNKTVDEFFSSIEGQKLESRLHEREEAARKKLEQARQDHQKRLGGLQEVQELNIQKAEAILANVARVEEAQAAVNGLIAQGMDWVDIARLIEVEQGRDNPVAKYIKLPLKLYENTITLLLGQAEEDEGDDSSYAGSNTESEASETDDEDSESLPSKRKTAKTTEDSRLAIDIDLSLTAWANASQYYDQKKSAAVKEERTLQASTKALKSAEQKITLDLKKGLTQEKDILRPVRKQFWFEKFHYFISSDGYLVLGGKDAQQNELLYRRYLKKGDIYVHADMNGASSVIIKNNPATPDAPIPPSTLSQAGTLSVTASSAWDSKAVMSAWWVNSDQVSKTAPTGEYLATGGFMIRGKKNYLPPAQMLLGFAVMFQISEESKPRHQKHRVQGLQRTDTGASMASFEAAPTAVEGRQVSAPGSDNDSDEEFPDAKLDAGQGESDDEDFPDVKLNGDRDVGVEDEPPAGLRSDAESEDEDMLPNRNPLQSGFMEDKLKSAPKDSLPDGEREEAQSPNESVYSTAADDIKAKSKAGTRHLSARERQLLHKGKDPASIIATEEKGDSESQDVSTDEAAASVASTLKGGKAQPLPRGKRGKQKRAAQKYANQDEEDRALAMRLLGSKSGQEAAAAEAAARKAKQEEEAAQKQRRREQHQRTQAAGKANEEARRAALEGTADTNEADEEDDESTRLALLGLDAFIGRPLPGDELLSAIPICAPWSALAMYKYKAKLQPGAQKKGKAVTEILGKWQAAFKNPKALDSSAQDVEKIWPREADLISGWKQVEVVGVIPVTKVRVMMGGGSDGRGGGGGGGGGKGKGKASGRGGKGSKKAR